MAGSAAAQSADQECESSEIAAFNDSLLGNWKGFRPSDVASRLGGMRAGRVWSPIVDSLEAIYLVERPATATPPSTFAGLSAQERNALLLELDALRAELHAAELDPTQLLRGRLTISRFDLAKPPIGTPTVTLFSGRATPIRLDTLSSNTRRSVCWLAIATKELMTPIGDPGRQALAEALNARVERWDNFSQKGYSMLPHELLINSWLPRGLTGRRDLEPPRVQWILAHPSVGAQMASNSFKSLSELRRIDVLAVEGFGFLVYGPQRAHYGGLTGVVTFPSSTGPGGAGVMAHYSAWGRAGFLWQGRDIDGKKRNAALISLDLYGRLTGVADRWKRLKEQSIADCLKAPQACVENARPKD